MSISEWNIFDNVSQNWRSIFASLKTSSQENLWEQDASSWDHEINCYRLLQELIIFFLAGSLPYLARTKSIENLSGCVSG